MGRIAASRRRARATALVGALAGLLLIVVAACGTQAGTPDPSTRGSAQPGNGGGAASWVLTPHAPIVETPYTKVMVIAEENEPEAAVVGSSQAPYLTKLARSYGTATNMQAGYPVSCPSLAAYIIITSGDRQGICDDQPPSVHPLSGDNIFQQVAAAGLQWRQYAESMPTNCSPVDGPGLVYVVRHAPPPYYTSENARCSSWDVPMGSTTSGALHSALASGLPAYSFVTPNTCNDMHGAASCRTSLIKRGDNWLAAWMPQIIASDDFQQAHLVVVITWDEGDDATNHIPTLVVAPTVRGITSGAAYTHCSTLRLAEDVLKLPLLGCAATAASFRTGFTF